MLGGIRLGEAIRTKGFSTRVAKTINKSAGSLTYNGAVAGTCTSACAYAFLGGVDRRLKGFEYLDENSELGFHQWYSDPSEPKIAALSEELAEIGISVDSC